MNRGIATPKKEKKYLTLLESDVGHALHVLGLGKHVQWYDLVDLKASTLTQVLISLERVAGWQET